MPSLESAQHETRMSAEEYGIIISSFLSRLDFRMPMPHQDSSLDSALSSYIEKQLWTDELKQFAKDFAHAPAISVASWYRKAPFSHRLHSAIFTLLAIIYDEDFANCGGSRAEFTARLIRGEAQETTFLDSLAQFLQSLSSFMGPYASSMMVKATIDFFEGTNLEARFTGVPRGATSFPRYLRSKTGYAEPYALLIFPESLFPEDEWRDLYLPAIPALRDMFEYVNDIMSFYKESIKGVEQRNFICNTAAARNCTPEEALQETTDIVVSRVSEIREILKPHPQLLSHAEDCVAAYAAWHLRNNKRYLLHEVKVGVQSQA
jgi:hypothetical protein